MRNRDKKSFPHLEGRIIMWKYSRYKEPNKIQYVLIAGCDYHVGYSLVDPQNTKFTYTCINGPLSPNKKSFKGLTKLDIDFQYLLDCVRNNKVYDVDERLAILEEHGIEYKRGGKQASCAFR